MSARQRPLHPAEKAVAAGDDAGGLREQATSTRECRATADERLVFATAAVQTAEDTEHARDDFLAVVSHELRTPLNAVLGWVRLLVSNQLAKERSGHAIETIERNAASLAHIIDDLLDVSRIMAGTLHIESRPVDLIAVTKTALDVVQPLAVSKHIDLRFSPAPGSIAPVRGDTRRLQQVIWNMLANAVKFTPQGGRVDVSVEQVGSNIEVSVADTGQGIIAEFLPHVFERFRRADMTPSRRHGGLGLGLAIVRQLVELHGGTVRAASDGDGRGATFTVHLPILVAHTRAQARPLLVERRHAESVESPTPRSQRLDRLRILVVDDDADGRTLTALVLTQAGASVKAVASARDALDVLEVQRPDVLISDIGLPDEDGYALVQRIRHHEAAYGGFLPAITLTGYARADDRHRAFAAGFQAHLAKPLEPAELIAAVADVTGRSMS
jgi:signal transduction histidine kinase/ActR/RegA family two-component response regulator